MNERALEIGDRPLARLGQTIRSMSPRAVAATAFALTLAAGAFDYVTGPQLGPLMFYLVPVGLVGWAGERWHSVAIGLLAAASWMLSEAVNGRTYDSPWVLGWNTLTRLVVFLLVGALLHRARAAVQHGIVEATNRSCPHCGSNDTIALRVGLVCQACKRLS